MTLYFLFGWKESKSKAKIELCFNSKPHNLEDIKTQQLKTIRHDGKLDTIFYFSIFDR